MLAEQPSFLDKAWRPVAAIVAAGTLALAAGCSSQSSESSGPTSTPRITHSASPSPGSETAPADMANANDDKLQILASYEQALHHNFDNEMYFTDMPRTVEEAESQADDMAHTLKEYGKYGIKPLIIMEPTNNKGGNIPLDKIHSHGYGHVLGALFKSLKDRGVTDEEMGTLIPMPEADLPNWGKNHRTDPALFAENYTAVGNACKRAFPEGELGLLLDSTAYPSGDVNYEHGDTSTASLMPYIDALKSTPDAPKVNSLMFQGFPFVDGSNPQEWLNGKVAVALARKLGVHNIWFNTGSASFINGHKVSPEVRGTLLNGELEQAKAAKAAGFTVMMNIFGGEDHNPTILWGYRIRNGTVAQPLPELMQDAGADGIDTALYADQR